MPSSSTGATEEADFRPAPARFTLREVMAHLPDWDTIFFARIQRTLEKAGPILEEHDESQRALDLSYTQTDVSDQMALFGERRAHLTEYLRALTPQQWERGAFHPRIGPISVEAQETLVALHDTYHLHQITQWCDAFAIPQIPAD